jgi:CheY-like chemotaxis protein
MNAAALKSVFQMFAQEDTALERSEGGLGIGLALVKGLVELHGGTVEAFSKGVGHGSEFTVHLPTILKDAHQPVVEASTPHGETGRRVLIADDNQDAAESLSFLLELQGHHVSVVHDGLEAFEAARRMRPSIVLLDIGMPGLNGYELAQKIRQEAWGQDMALIAATGWGQDDDRMRAFAAGFDAHVTKPFDPAHLLDLVGSIQRSERRLTGRSP